MTKPAKGSLQSLDPSAKLFVELKKQNPEWWSLLCNDKEVYIHIRKDNYINAYYYGGSIIKLEYKRGEFVGETHHKYYEELMPDRDPKKTYMRVELNKFDKATMEHIKKKIREEYSDRNSKKKYSEKKLQGEMIINNPNYIDSEFQFNVAEGVDKLRIDLTELSYGTIRFIELKLITDSRLLNLKSQSGKKEDNPEIVSQMKKYNCFIKSQEKGILCYYKKLLKIRKSLGLNTPDFKSITVCESAKLIIKNTYKNENESEAQKRRIEAIKRILKSENIEYELK